jgi:hypothetical protein
MRLVKRLIVLLAVLALLAPSIVTAVDRMVIGEMFTNTS